MPIQLPHEVALFLNFCGVPYPDVNEDDVRKLGEHVRNFAVNVQQTHESATGVVKDLGSVYSGYSYEQLVAAWSRMSIAHMADLDQACKVVADALDIAADVITVVKVAVLAELAALAVSYGAIMLTPAGPATGPVLTAAARRICDQMQQNLIAYLVAEVVIKAIEPFEHVIDEMIRGVVYDVASDALGVPPGNPAAPLHIEPDEVLRYANVLDEHADEIMRHAQEFAEQAAALDYTTRHLDTPEVSAVPGPGRTDSELPKSRTDFDPPSASSGLLDPSRPSSGGPPLAAPPTADMRASGAGDGANNRPSVGVDHSDATKVADGRHPVGAGATAPPTGALADSPARVGADGSGWAPSQHISAPDHTLQPQRSADMPDGSDESQARRADVPAATPPGAEQTSIGVDHHGTDPLALGNREATDAGEVTGGGSAPVMPRTVGATDRSIPATPWTAAARTSTPRATPGGSSAPKSARTESVRPDRTPVASPWSTTDRPSVIAPKVSAPSTTRPTPWPRTDRTSDSDKRETRSAEMESADVPGTAGETPPISAPETSAPETPHRAPSATQPAAESGR